MSVVRLLTYRSLPYGGHKYYAVATMLPDYSYLASCAYLNKNVDKLRITNYNIADPHKIHGFRVCRLEKPK